MAKEWHVRPLSLISFGQPSSEWEALDFLLVKAYETVLNYRCPQCGEWVWVCSDEVPQSAAVSHSFKKVLCRKSYARERFTDSLKDNKHRAGNEEKKMWGISLKSESKIDALYAERHSMPTIDDYLNATGEHG